MSGYYVQSSHDSTSDLVLDSSFEYLDEVTFLPIGIENSELDGTEGHL
jgi:hypothetical protein